MPISKKIETFIASASWIRRMFEEGTRLRAVHGEENVFDFSLGNPTLEPPPAFQTALVRAATAPAPGSHRYMPNPGYPDVRAKIAMHLASLHGKPFSASHVLMTTGAAGAANCTLKALLDPGDEVLVLAPFFPEYRFYIDNHGGRMVVVETDEDFDLDVGAVEAAITPRTRAVIVNSPNNPTGRIYEAERLALLGEVLGTAQRRHGRSIYLIGDEPYRKIVYGAEVPSLFAAHPNTVVCTSHSKDLGLPGERIGYASINPDCSDSGALFDAMAFTNRILGYVNAPALMQRVVADLQDESIDTSIYRHKRDLFLAGLRDAGYEVVEPEGAFYLFPKSPLPDDVAFVHVLARHLVLAVPGVGFSRGGYFRLAYCVDDQTIERALPRFREAILEVKGS
jgi:aspartate aminotransferase